LKRGNTFAIARSLQSESSALPEGNSSSSTFRNILIHGYAAVDDRIVWGVIENYLASLSSAAERLLGARNN